MFQPLIDGKTTSIYPEIVCKHKHLCLKKDCIRKSVQYFNSVVFVPEQEIGKDCKFYIKGD